MKNILDIDCLEDDKFLIHKTEITKLYYDEFKYRHAHLWSLYFKCIYIVLFLFSLYFIGDNYVKKLGNNNQMFIKAIIVAIILTAIASCMIINDEYYRVRCVFQRYNELLEQYKHKEIKRNIILKFFGKQLGKLMIIFFIGLSMILICVLYYILSTF